MKNNKSIAMIVLSMAILATTAACNSTPSQSSGTPLPEQTASESPQQSTQTNGVDGSGIEIKVINVAHSAASRPYNYVNADGESDGYEVAVLREVDALLPQYEFNFVPIPDDADLLIGTELGRYEMSVKAAWITEERLEKFVFPQYPIGASNIGLLIRSEDRELYADMEAFAREKGKLVPISPMSAQYAVILEFNEEHPETPIELLPSDAWDAAEVYRWVIEGRYDGYFMLRTSYERNIKEEDSPYHQYDELLHFFPYRGLTCWPLFHRDQQALADAYDVAFLQLLESGRIDEIMYEYLDENTFDYIIEEEYQYLKRG